MLTRRGFFAGVAALVAAPKAVKLLPPALPDEIQRLNTALPECIHYRRLAIPPGYFDEAGRYMRVMGHQAALSADALAKQVLREHYGAPRQA